MGVSLGVIKKSPIKYNTLNLDAINQSLNSIQTLAQPLHTVINHSVNINFQNTLETSWLSSTQTEEQI